MANIEAEYRRFTPLRGGKGKINVRLTGLESIGIDQVAPPRMEISRAGRRFALGNTAAITGIAPVQALPTTSAQWVIWNADKNKSLVFEEVGMYLTAGTPGVGGVLLGAIIKAPAVVGATRAGTAITSMSDGGIESNSIIAVSQTVTDPAAPNWIILASNNSPNVTAFASSTFLEHRSLWGGLIIPPQQGLALNVLAPAGTTPLFAPFGQWCEIELDLE